jgi:hypothetical protein
VISSACSGAVGSRDGDSRDEGIPNEANDAGKGHRDALADAAVNDDGDHSDAGPRCEIPTRRWNREVHKDRYSLDTHVAARDVAMGRETCIVDARGTVFCDDATGSFGEVALPAPAESLAAGEGGTCAVLRTGQIACWGCAASAHALFDGTPFEPARVHVLSLVRMKAVTVGRDVACGLTTAGGIWCWGVGERRNWWQANRTGFEVCSGERPERLPSADLPE